MRYLLLSLALLGCRTQSAPVGRAEPSPTRASQASTGSARASPSSIAPQEIGSERGSRVAIERGPGARRLVYFASGLDQADVEELHQLAPRVEVVTGLSPAAALARAAEADGIDARYASAEFLRAAKNLVWVQARSVGVERYLALPELRENERIVLTNARATSGPAIADHAFAMLLALTRDLEVHLRARDTGSWNRDGSGKLTPVALQERTLLVLGLGGIGTEIARRGHGFGMRVLALRRSDEPGPDFVERVGKPGDLHAMLAEADVVAVALPLTAETEGLLDARAFASMKPGAYLVNVARGRIVLTDALLEALRSGRLAGAALDVTDPEPLPRDHPLWKLPNVVITPHVSARAELTEERGRALVLENLRRFDAGEGLLNVVDKEAGY